MILAYSNLENPGFIALLSEETQEVIQEIPLPENTKKQSDILLGIARLLAKTQKETTDITGIALHVGPGKFTAVRTACIVANILAKELNIPLFPMTTEVEASPMAFAKIVSTKGGTRETSVEPIFLGAPNIGKKVKEPFPFSSDSTKIRT